MGVNLGQEAQVSILSPRMLRLINSAFSDFVENHEFQSRILDLMPQTKFLPSFVLWYASEPRIQHMPSLEVAILSKHPAKFSLFSILYPHQSLAASMEKCACVTTLSSTPKLSLDVARRANNCPLSISVNFFCLGFQLQLLIPASTLSYSRFC